MPCEDLAPISLGYYGEPTGPFLYEETISGQELEILDP
jgi:hypothetical protein